MASSDLSSEEEFIGEMKAAATKRASCGERNATMSDGAMLQPCMLHTTV